MKRAFAGIVAMGVLAAAALFGVANPASAATRVVKAGESIQAAIDAASPGDTIILKRGTYRENLSITKDRITIIGNGATLLPPATPGPSTLCDALFADEGAPPPPASNGICIEGVIDFETFEVTDYVVKPRISGLTVNDFTGVGIFGFGTENASYNNNAAHDNGVYGIFELSSKNPSIIGNRTSGSDEAGIYVGGAHPSGARILANDTYDNTLGIFIRDAENLAITGNRIHDNCAGIFVLADAPGPAGALSITGNIIKNNSKLCELPPDEGGTISGLGIGLSGAHDVRVVGNIITNNTAAPGVAEHAGVGVFTGDGGTVATGNVVRGNVLKGNNPDIVWDGAGTNTFASNAGCTVSIPAGLC